MRRTGAGRPTPRGDLLVGRDGELQRLAGLLAEAKEGHGHLVFITGEPGTGKTALANDFLRRGGPAPQSAPHILPPYAPSWCLQLPAAAPGPDLAETLKQQTLGVTRERMLRE